jgi:hypothetical protein
MVQVITAVITAVLASVHATGVQAVPPIGLSIEDSARFLGVRVETIEYRIRNGDLACVHVGEQRTRMVLIKDLIAFADARRQPTADELLKNKKKPKQNRK